MSVLWDDLAVVFFISRERATACAAVEDLLRVAGMRDFHPEPRVPGLYQGTWADMGCESTQASLESYRVLVVRFGRGTFANRLHPRPDSDDLDQEPGLPIAEAFRDACDTLEVDVGMLLTANWQSDEEWIAKQEWVVLGLFSLHLLGQGIGLLYLDDERVRALSSHPHLADHDQLPARRGRLYFARSGRGRWP